MWPALACRSSGRQPEDTPRNENSDLSPTGTYSVFSRGASGSEWGHRKGMSGSDWTGRGSEAESGRYVGTREWNSHARGGNKLGGTRNSDPWSGPGRDVNGDGKGSASDPSSSEGWDQHENSDGHYPPYPYTQQLSANSGLSHDLSGFSAFGGGHDRDGSMDSLPLPEQRQHKNRHHDAAIAGTGAAAAAAADATNKEALSSSPLPNDKKRPKKRLTPPGPSSSGPTAKDSSISDNRGDTKEEAAFRVVEPYEVGRRDRGPGGVFRSSSSLAQFVSQYL